MKLILGSQSKNRKEILEKAGYVFDIVVPDVNEKAIKTPDPYQRSLILARAKAEALISKIKEPAVIIASDLIVMSDGVLYEKPETEREAREFLKKYSEGMVAEAVCAIVVVNTETHKKYEGIDKSKVSFKPFSDAVIEDFIKNGEPLTRAGAFSVTHPILKPYVNKIEGSESCVMGLSLILLQKLLEQVGYKKQN